MGGRRMREEGKIWRLRFFFLHLRSEKQKFAGLITPGFYPGNPICPSALHSGTWMFQQQVLWCISWLCLLWKTSSLRKLIKSYFGSSCKNNVVPGAGRGTVTSVVWSGMTEGWNPAGLNVPALPARGLPTWDPSALLALSRDTSSLWTLNPQVPGPTGLSLCMGQSPTLLQGSTSTRAGEKPSALPSCEGTWIWPTSVGCGWLLLESTALLIAWTFSTSQQVSICKLPTTAGWWDTCSLTCPHLKQAAGPSGWSGRDLLEKCTVQNKYPLLRSSPPGLWLLVCRQWVLDTLPSKTSSDFNSAFIEREKVEMQLWEKCMWHLAVAQKGQVSRWVISHT